MIFFKPLATILGLSHIALQSSKKYDELALRNNIKDCSKFFEKYCDLSELKFHNSLDLTAEKQNDIHQQQKELTISIGECIDKILNISLMY